MSCKNMQCFEEKKDYLKDKKVLFIATKNIDYIRIVQERLYFKKYAFHTQYIVSERKGYFSRIFEVFLKLLFEDIDSYDLIFIGFQAQFILPLFYWKMRKKEIWSDFFISLYDTLVFDRKKLKEKSLLALFTKFIDKYTIDKSDLIICDTMAHGKYFCDEFEMDINKISVYYLEADRNIYYPRKTLKPTEYSDKFIVFYFGSILPLQGVEVVLEAAEILRDKEAIHFILVGPMGKKIERKELENITYIDWLSQDELSEYIAFADLCLAGHFSSTIEKAKRTIPGKAYIYDAMNKKIILGDCSANHELYKESDRYIFVEQGSGRALAEVIVKEYTWEKR